MLPPFIFIPTTELKTFTVKLMQSKENPHSFPTSILHAAPACVKFLGGMFIALGMLIIPASAATIAPTLTVAARLTQETKTVHRYRTVAYSNLLDFTPSKLLLSTYGGRKDRRETASGFFRTAKTPLGWVLVDPEGYPFLSIGINSVEPYPDSAGPTPAFVARYQNTSNWARQTRELLIDKTGFNTLGCWSDDSEFRKAGIRLPYCPRWNFLQGYAHARKGYTVAPGTPTWSKRQALPVFDPEFRQYCEAKGAAIAATKNDPWLLGHFTDNEIPFTQEGMLKAYLIQPETDPGYRAAKKWLADQGKSIETAGPQDDGLFCEFMISHYFAIVSATIKKYDPNHMIIGSRFHGRPSLQRAVFRAAQPFVDVVTVNYYGKWTPDQNYINEIAALSGKPIMITEWYSKADDSGLDNRQGAGFSVASQSERALHYENFTIALLRNKNVVGWHWFKYSDDQEKIGAMHGNQPFTACNKGVISLNLTPWQVLLDSMNKINTRAYQLSDYLRGLSDPNLPNYSEVTKDSPPLKRLQMH